MVLSLSKTVDISCEHFPAEMLPQDVFGLIDGFFVEDSPHKVVSVQAIPRRTARVTFDNVEAKTYYEGVGVVMINGVRCEVITPPPPPPSYHVS